MCVEKTHILTIIICSFEIHIEIIVFAPFYPTSTTNSFVGRSLSHIHEPKAKHPSNSFSSIFALLTVKGERREKKKNVDVRPKERISNHFLSFHYYFVLFYFYGILNREKKKKNRRVFFSVFRLLRSHFDCVRERVNDAASETITKN